MQTLKNIWKNEDLRKRILVTLLILLIYRIGCGIPVPFVEAGTLTDLFTGHTLLGYYNTLSGGALSQSSVFAVGVSAYITASIVVQLLSVAIPKLEQMSKEETGQQFLDKLTKGIGMAFALTMSFGYYFVMLNNGGMKYSTGVAAGFQCIVVVAAMVAGAQLVMWLGWQIDEHGVGNGISMIIFIGIVSRWSELAEVMHLFVDALVDGHLEYLFIIVAVCLACVGILLYVVAANDAERRIPVQYATRVAGSKTYGGGKSYIPIKMIASGVMPIIFASTICGIPSLIVELTGSALVVNPVYQWFVHGFGYIIVYSLLILAFNYFYMSISFDAVEMANTLRRNGGNVPGYRPGKLTSEHIQKEVNSLIPASSFVLVVVACLPTLMSMFTGYAFQFGGTSLLIMVGVALELFEAIDSAMIVRHHKGFLN